MPRLPKLSPAQRDLLRREIFAEMGRKGSAVTNAMSPEKRKERARLGAQARWKNHTKKNGVKSRD